MTIKHVLHLLLAGTFAACSSETTSQPESGALAALIQRGGELKPGAIDQTAGIEVGRDRGKIHMLRATTGVLVADDASVEPEARARAFLANYGAVIGLAADERRSLPVRTRTVLRDAVGTTVRLAQLYRGLPVFGGELVVGMNDDGITSVNGVWIDGLALPTTPTVTAQAASEAALVLAAKQARDKDTLAAVATTLGIFQKGLVELTRTSNHLGWNVTVSAGNERFMVWIDAQTGEGLATYALTHTDSGTHRRTAYAGSESDDVTPDPNYQPGPTAVCWDRYDGTPSPTNTVSCQGAAETLYRFSGQTYDMFFQGFMHDSYDGMGIRMKTVNLVNNNCPNAYWNGDSTNYCPGFELDDVVAHEWGHAYTQYTHGLIYSYQSGALNEAYSDIWGETLDLLNGEDGLAGGNNEEPAPAGNRWQVGEDFGTGNGEYELLLRDMWDPDRLAYPGKVTSPNYFCGSGDNGGVHYNSGVPNHAYALLVDGTSRLTGNQYNGQTIAALGFAKTAAIYYRAMVTKQTPTTNFPQHATALEQSCDELVGQDPKEFLAELEMPSSATITAQDCEQVRKAMLAVEMRTPPSCGYEPLLKPNPPAACLGATARFTETWSDDLAGWTKSASGSNPEFPAEYTWKISAMKPNGRPGKAAFAENFSISDGEVGGTCAPGGDYSGAYRIDSPTITAPASGTRIEMRFDHYVETELGYDGGQLYVAVGNGQFQLVPQDRFLFNGYNQNLEQPPPVGLNTNPNAGEPAWTGADEGGSTGSWGTTVVDLTGLVPAGAQYKLRFEFSVDGCNGVTGWYIGDLVVNDCPPLTGPVLSVTGYENAPNGPDTNGNFTLNWTRPAPATGPDDLQQSTLSCVPLLAETCEGGFGMRWTSTGDATQRWQSGRQKQNHPGRVFAVTGLEGEVSVNANLVTSAKYTLPANRPATLRWDEWFVNESDDRGYVEVCSAMACPPDDVTEAGPWEKVYEVDRVLGEPGGASALTTEPMLDRKVNLSHYAGKAIQIRFRYELGGFNRPASTPHGWFIDNILLETDAWDPLLTNQNVQTFAVAGRADGTYCFRARTAYTIQNNPVDSHWSNVVTVVVDQPGTPLDSDGDGVVDTSDNCVTTPNTDQANTDADPAGDACDCHGDDATGDGDGDDYCDTGDNCPLVPNPTQADSDMNGLGDACDCAAGADSDGDMVCNAGDNCPDVANTDQTDTDGDGAGDACDVCDGTSNTDDDMDAVCNENDNCPAVGNPQQTDEDADGIGDACDCVAANDMDSDGACDDTDNCPAAANPSQADEDEDGIGDECDLCRGAANDGDSDNDNVCNANDNCPDTANEDQADADSDGTGDACVCVADVDADGVCDDVDACPNDSDAANQDPALCVIDDGGCGCQAGADVGASALTPWLFVGYLVMRRRRRQPTRS